MRSTEIKQSFKQPASLYATSSDFCRIFKEDMNNLFLLSLLLTADRDQAEQCLVAGLDDCAGANRVFKEWARSWARRAIIQNAVRLIAPSTQDDVDAAPARQGSFSDALSQSSPMLRAELSAVLSLPAYARFAFVLSALEGYHEKECALLLGWSRQSLIEARTRALQQIGLLVETEYRNREQRAFKMDMSTNNGNLTTLAVPCRLANTA